MISENYQRKAMRGIVSHQDEQHVAKIWDEQEQARVDELSSDPLLDHLPATKSKGEASRLLGLLDSLSPSKESVVISE